MKKIIAENIEIERQDVSREEALKQFKEIGDEYKLELLEAIPEDEQVSIYEQGDFFDLCRGVHVPSTGKLKEFKLLSLLVHTGAVTQTIKCFNVFTVLHSLKKKS